MYFGVAGMTVEVATADSIEERRLPEATTGFRMAAPGPDVIRICHQVVAHAPEVPARDPGRPVRSRRFRGRGLAQQAEPAERREALDRRAVMEVKPI